MDKVTNRATSKGADRGAIVTMASAWAANVLIVEAVAEVQARHPLMVATGLLVIGKAARLVRAKPGRSNPGLARLAPCPLATGHQRIAPALPGPAATARRSTPKANALPSFWHAPVSDQDAISNA